MFELRTHARCGPYIRDFPGHDTVTSYSQAPTGKSRALEGMLLDGRFIHGHYGRSRYLPLYILCGEHRFCARRRPSSIDGTAGSLEEMTRIVKRMREGWPKTRLVIRGESGFARYWLMNWCEEQQRVLYRSQRCVS